MALTTAGFMALGGINLLTLSVKLDKIDMSQVLQEVLVADKAFLGHIKMGPASHNIERNWIEDELNPAYIVASSSANNRLTITGFTVTASLVRVLRKYSIVNPAGTEIYVDIKADPTATNRATMAAYGNSTWASWTTTKCYIVAKPWKDVDDASEDISQIRTKRKNWTQVFEKAIQITETREGVDMEAVASDLSLQTIRRTQEIKRDLDMSVINGVPWFSTTFQGGIELRTMAGVIKMIMDGALSGTDQTTTITQVSAALSAGYINSLCYKIYEQGGLDETSDPIILVGPAQQRIISAMERDIRRLEQGERSVGYYRNIFLSDLGTEFPIVVDRWVPKDKLIIYDRSRGYLFPLAGDAWHLTKLAKTGRSTKYQLSGQYGLMLSHGDKAHGLLYDLS